VWKVTWAHPEFGQVLASCSFDRTAAVWEEQGTIYRAHDLYDMAFITALFRRLTSSLIS